MHERHKICAQVSEILPRTVTQIEMKKAEKAKSNHVGRGFARLSFCRFSLSTKPSHLKRSDRSRLSIEAERYAPV